MGLKVRENHFKASTNIRLKELIRTSRSLTHLTGLDVQVNKAITGENAFAHSSGIHQDGLLKDKQVYEIMSPEDVGADSMELILTARSGRHAFKNAVEKLGFETGEGEDFEALFAKFLRWPMPRRKYMTMTFYLVTQHRTHEEVSSHLYELDSFQVVTNDLYPTATVKLRKARDVQGQHGGDGDRCAVQRHESVGRFGRTVEGLQNQ